MRRIYTAGNLPKHLSLLAKSLGGILSKTDHTEFYEMTNIDEFEKAAAGELKDDIKFEIVPPTVDMSTGRGFLVGFQVEEPKKIVTLQSYVTMKVYFIECSSSDVIAWTDKIRSHRQQQEEDMRQRRSKKGR